MLIYKIVDYLFKIESNEWSSDYKNYFYYGIPGIILVKIFECTIAYLYFLNVDEYSST